MTEPSGAAWCERYPTSTSLNDLDPAFGDKVSSFVTALQDAGAEIIVSATYRPVERAYLMHWAWKIANSDVLPVNIPPCEGVDIDWSHGDDLDAAKRGAQEMVSGYNIVSEPSLTSHHTQRIAIDMTIHWKGVIYVTDARGINHACDTQEKLWPIGSSYGVMKLASDAPHWSSDSH